MTSQVIRRLTRGDLTIAIVALALFSAVVVAGVSAYSEFTIVKKDIDSAVKNTKGYILNRIRNDLTETVIEQNPAAAQAILAGILANAKNNARDNLGPASTAYLASRNPGDLSTIFDASTISLNGSIISFQVQASAAVSVGFPTVYETRTKIISGTLKELIAIFDSGLSFDCGSDCGSCGQCDSRTNQCIGVSKVVDGVLMTPDTPVNGKFACKDFGSSLNGQQCTELGGLVIQEAGLDICQMANCKFREGYYAWNFDNTTGAADIIYQGSTEALDIDQSQSIFQTNISGSDITLMRGPQFSFANNTKEPNSPVFAVCEGDYKFVFVTSQAYTGNFVGQANDLINQGLIAAPPSGSYHNYQGPESAHAICNYHAGLAGLPGEYLAIIESNYYFTTSQANYRSIMETEGTDYMNVNGEVVIEGGFYSTTESDSFAGIRNNNKFNKFITVDEFGNEPYPSTTRAWVGIGVFRNCAQSISGDGDWSSDCNFQAHQFDPDAACSGGNGNVNATNLQCLFLNCATWSRVLPLSSCDVQQPLYCMQKP